MEKEVLVSIKGLQFSGDGNPEKVETINRGDYYKKGDHHYVIFDEVIEGFDSPTRNMIKFYDGSCSVNKKGVVNVNMLFEENKQNLTNYVTPFGNILIGIDTGSIDISESENQIDIFVHYSLEANYEHLADCQLEITIKNRSEGFLLS